MTRPARSATTDVTPRSWNLILAAGAGTRLAPVTGSVPKQFWRRASEPTLLERTLGRLERLAPRERTVVVTAEAHRPYVQALAGALRGIEVVHQPLDRGTALGVALGLLPIVARDPGGLVVVSPSDHGVDDLRRFQDGLRAAVAHTRRSGETVVFGVEPTASVDDYGWIVPDAGAEPAAPGIRPVRAFHEKPDRPRAEVLFRSGGVWNTMIVAARARTLLDAALRAAPEARGVFEAALAVDSAAREQLLRKAYPTLRSVDFSRDVLGRLTPLMTYVWPASLRWSDLGTPERLSRWSHPSIQSRPAASRQPARLPRAYAAGRSLADEPARCPVQPSPYQSVPGRGLGRAT